MKKLNRKGFTLIELLAVIVIMGILMLVAIPAMQRYINNSRKDTYVNTVKAYVDAVKTAYAGDRLSCSGSEGNYYITFENKNSDKGAVSLLESGGNSPYSGAGALTGVIYINATSTPVSYSVNVTDGKGNGISGTSGVNVNGLSRGNVGVGVAAPDTPSGYTKCTVSD